MKEPDTVKSQNRVVASSLPLDDGHRVRRESRQAYWVEELPDELFAAIERATYPTAEEITAAGIE